MRPLKSCTRGLRPLDPFRRTGLKKKTNGIRLELETCQASFRAKESQEASRKMNEFIFRSVCLAFAVRFAHSPASEAGLPGNGSLRSFCNCGKQPDEQVMQYPPMAGTNRR